MIEAALSETKVEARVLNSHCGCRQKWMDFMSEVRRSSIVEVAYFLGPRAKKSDYTATYRPGRSRGLWSHGEHRERRSKPVAHSRGCWLNYLTEDISKEHCRFRRHLKRQTILLSIGRSGSRL